MLANAALENKGQGVDPLKLPKTSDPLSPKGSILAFYLVKIKYTALCENKDDPRIESIELWPATRNWDGSIEYDIAERQKY